MNKKLWILVCCCGLSMANIAFADGTTNGGFYLQTGNGLSRNNDVESATKTGKACSYSILSLVAFGDAKISDAKLDAGITNVSAVDNTAFNVLGIYGKYCTIVKGN